jgi:hypothetical protein
MRDHRWMGSLTITAELEPRGPAAAFVLDEDQAAVIGEGAKRFPARTSINGATLRTTVTKMRGEYLFGLNRAAREQAGLTLAEALKRDAQAQEQFDALAHSHRKEFARWVAEAKREPTRDKRVAETLEMLRAGRTRG